MRKFSILILFSLFILSSWTFFADMVGEWTYTAPSAPQGFQAGEIHITEAEETLEVTFQIGTMKIPAQKISISGDTLKCSMYVQQSSVPVELIFDGNEFTGKALSPEGYIKILGNRKVK